MGNHFCVLAVMAVLKALCQAGKDNILDYAPSQNVFTGSYLLITYYYYSEADNHTEAPCLAALFRYRFQAICCEFEMCRCFVLMLILQTVLYIRNKYKQKTCNANLLDFSN